MLPTDLVAFNDRRMKLVVEPGLFNVFIGSSTADIRLTGEFRLTGDTARAITCRRFFSRATVT
jgi:beta-glucosidase